MMLFVRSLPESPSLLALGLLASILLVSGRSPARAEEGGGERLFYESREEVPLQYRWNLDDLFPDRAAFDRRVQDLEARLPALAEYKGRLAESPEKLVAALELQFELLRGIENVFVYANERLHSYAKDTEAQELASRAQGLYAKISEATAFLDPEIAQIPEDRMKELLDSEGVQAYAHYLDNIARTREHMRSPEVEEVLAGASLLTSAPGQIFAALQNTDIPWPTITGEDGEPLKVVPGQYTTVVKSEDRRVREEGSLAYFSTYDQYATTLAATYGANIQRDIWRARTRGYGSTLEMALDGTHVPRSVVDTLVSTVGDHVEKVHDYAAFRKQVQGLDELHVYDLYVNLLPGIDKKYNFEEGWELAMRFWRETFGEEYAKAAERARAERWVDVYTNEGKRPGAYSWGTFDSHPYLLLNWSGDLSSVSTLVHEMGHAIHRYLACENQPFRYSGYSLFVAEVASVASESLFLEWMFDGSTDPVERKLLLNQAMDEIVGTFVRQIFFHEFEAEAHAMAERGEPLTKESLGTLYEGIWNRYWGPELIVDPPYRAGWSRISHFYRTFYVWVYATSYAAGEAIAARFREGDEGAVQDYLAMLRLGGSVYPMEAVARAGVDMNDPQVIRAVMDRFGELQERLKAEMLPPTP